MKRSSSLLLVLAATNQIINAQETVPTDIGSPQAQYQKVHDAAKWGLPTTNGIQLGLAMYKAESSKEIMISTYLYDSNLCNGLIYPPHGHKMVLTLLGPDGKVTPKTEALASICAPLTSSIKDKILSKANMNLEDTGNYLTPKVPMLYEQPFNLFECFKLNMPGAFTLTVNATIFKLKPDKGAYEIALPPASLQLLITQQDLDNFKLLKLK